MNIFSFFLPFVITVTQSITDLILLNSALMSTQNGWRIVNDNVMGGRSSSVSALIENGVILFEGNISLENNGGFASLRSPINNYNFSDYSGIEIKIKGDGKIYSISMKETSYFTGLFFTSAFNSKKNEWLVVKLPFSEFKSKYFGRKLDSDEKIRLEKIKEIALLISEKQEGDFRTEIDYVKLYR